MVARRVLGATLGHLRADGAMAVAAAGTALQSQEPKHSPAGMSQRDKFLLDMHGYLVVEEFLTKEEVRALNQSFDANWGKRFLAGLLLGVLVWAGLLFYGDSADIVKSVASISLAVLGAMRIWRRLWSSFSLRTSYAILFAPAWLPTPWVFCSLLQVTTLAAGALRTLVTVWYGTNSS